MISRTAVMALSLTIGLALAGCSEPAEPAAEASSTPASPAASAASPTESGSPSPSASGDAAPEVSTDIKDLPEFIKPYKGSTVVSNSFVPADPDQDRKLDHVSLVMKTDAKAEDVFAYYTKALEKAGFEQFGKEEKSDAGRVINFHHKDSDASLVVTISADPGEKGSSIVTVGGTVAP